MPNLTDFLLARITEDEAIAHAAMDGDEWLTDEKLTGDCDLHPDTSAHIIRWSQARVLAECETKRRIVSSFAASSEPLTARTAEMAVVRMVLKLLAQPYRDHPDFDPSWRAE